MPMTQSGNVAFQRQATRICYMRTKGLGAVNVECDDYNNTKPRFFISGVSQTSSHCS